MAQQLTQQKFSHPAQMKKIPLSPTALKTQQEMKPGDPEKQQGAALRVQSLLQELPRGIVPIPEQY